MLSCLLMQWLTAQGGAQGDKVLPNESVPCVRIPPRDIERERERESYLTIGGAFKRTSHLLQEGSLLR